MSDAPEPKPTLPPAAAVAILALLLAGFALLSRLAIADKSPTYDEPMHLAGAWVHRHLGDFRINMEDPPLWHYWAALPIGRDELRFDRAEPFWREMPFNYYRQWPFAHRLFYGDLAVDAHAIFTRARTMMIAFGVLAGVVVAGFAWKLGGPVAAVLATALFALDPTFLGHAPLLKNDVAISFFFLAIAYASFLVGRRATVGNVLLLGLLCGGAVITKFSGVLAAPFVVLLMGFRALMGTPWIVFGRELRSRAARLLGAGGIVAACALLGVVCIWAGYGFRYHAIPVTKTPLNFRNLELEVAMFKLQREQPGRAFTAEELDAHPKDAPTRFVLWANEHRLLPEAWLAGFLYTHGHNQSRGTFFLGEVRNRGTSWYFPVAAAVKSPVGSVVAVLATVAALAWWRSKRRCSPFARWATACLAIPTLLYLALALMSPLNLGVRHVLPVYPALFIAFGVAAARLATTWKRLAIPLLLVLTVAAETLPAFPNYIAFFNAAAGGPRGGLALLGDSNLDWGQDLPALAEWQRRNPDIPLFLSYFGQADPASYGIRYRNVPTGRDENGVESGVDFGGYQFGPPGKPFDPASDWGVLAVGATNLQGIYLAADPFAPFRKGVLERTLPAFEELNGTIYLFPIGTWPTQPPPVPSPPAP
jgi:hypothetical protein